MIKNPHILVVDDQKGLRTVMRRILEMQGYDVAESSSGEEALTFLKKEDQSVDVILLDIGMPGLNGLEVLGSLKEHPDLSRIKVIMLTAATQPQDKVRSFSAGAADYIEKPFEEQEFVARVELQVKLKRGEEELRESEERFRQMSELSPFPVCIRTPDGYIEYLNPRFVNDFGYTLEDIPTVRAWFELAYPDIEYRNQVISTWETDRPLFTKHEPVKRTFEVTCKDGSIKIVTVRALLVENDKTYMVFHDITEAKRAEEEIAQKNEELLAAEEELRQINEHLDAKVKERTAELTAAMDQLQSSQEQLLQSEKLAAVGQLVSGVEHEINNPLMAIYSTAQLMLRYVEDETAREDVENLQADTKRAITIVRNLLSFARKQEPQRNYISVNDPVQSVIELLSYELNLDNIEVVTDLSPDIPCTMADFQQLQQVFLNLIINAEQAMKNARGKGKLTIRSQQVGENIQVIFADDGPGMSANVQNKIFEPFFTTKDVGEGTGLGLSICYGIIEDHGGQICVESKDGEGTTFTIELPVVLDPVSCG